MSNAFDLSPKIDQRTIERPDRPIFCSKCREFYWRSAFAADASRLDGCQSYCRYCKQLWEVPVENGWKRFSAWLRNNEPKSVPHWTFEIYDLEIKKADGECWLCGAGLHEWQSSGHFMDRINNNTPHIPGNCRVLCWPCNSLKGAAPSTTADQMIREWVAKYGRGKVQWDELYPRKFKRPVLPDLSSLRVVLFSVSDAPKVKKGGR